MSDAIHFIDLYYFSDDLNEVKELLGSGAYAHIKDELNRTPVHLAAQNGDSIFDCPEWRIALNIYRWYFSGHYDAIPVLFRAIKKQNMDVINAIDTKKMRPLDYAIQSGNVVSERKQFGYVDVNGIECIYTHGVGVTVSLGTGLLIVD